MSSLPNSARRRSESPIRLGMGEYQGADRESERADARNRFLRAVREDKPAVLESLADRPLAAFRQAADALASYRVPRWSTLELLADDEDDGPAFAPLRDAIKSWGIRWRLTDDWCLDQALATLEVWVRTPSYLEHREWAGIATAMFLPMGAEERRFSFEHEGWDSTSDTRKEAEAGIRAAFDRALVEYLGWVEARSEERKLIRTPEVRRADRFSWLVRMHFEDESGGEIARAEGLTESAVNQAVSGLACAIRLSRHRRVN